MTDREPRTGRDGFVITRVWTDRNVGPRRQVVLTVRPGRDLPAGEPVERDGVRYSVQDNGATARIAWADPARSPAGRILQLDADGLGLRGDGLVQLAQRIVPAATRFSTPLELRWVPGSRPRYRSSVTGDDPLSVVATITVDASDERAGVLTVTLAPRTGPPPDGETVAVHGRPAELIEDTDPATGRPRQRIVQPSPDDLSVLTVAFDPAGGPLLTRPDLIRAADAVSTGRSFDAEWLTG